METPINTATGLREYFFDSIFYAYPQDYPPLMTREQFDQYLDAYRNGMNDHNDCSFPHVGRLTVSKWYNEYKAEKACRA